MRIWSGKVCCWGDARSASLALTAQAIAQRRQLPQVTVEGKGRRPRRGTAKGAPKAAPQQAEPAAAGRDRRRPRRRRRRTPSTTRRPPSARPTKSELDTFGQVDTGDVLRTMPGTFTRESPQQPRHRREHPRPRRFGPRQHDDRRRAPELPLHRSRGARLRLRRSGRCSPASTSQRGAVSTAGGAGALAGTANLRTLDVDDIIKPGQNTGVLTSVTYGTNGVGWSEMFAAGARTGSVGIAGAISKRDQDNYQERRRHRACRSRTRTCLGLFKTYFKPTDDPEICRFGGVFYDNDFSANSLLPEHQVEDLHCQLRLQAAQQSADRFRGQRVYDQSTEHDLPPRPQLVRDRRPAASSRTMAWASTFPTSRGSAGARSASRCDYGDEYFDDDDGEQTECWRGVNSDGKSSIAGAFSQTTLHVRHLRSDRWPALRPLHARGHGTVHRWDHPPLPPPRPMVRSRSISPRDGSIPR